MDSYFGGESKSAKATTPPNVPMCRNVFIYGYCKFENKGCQFRHDNPDEPKAVAKSTPSKSINPTAREFVPKVAGPLEAEPVQGAGEWPASGAEHGQSVGEWPATAVGQLSTVGAAGFSPSVAGPDAGLAAFADLQLGPHPYGPYDQYGAGFPFATNTSSYLPATVACLAGNANDPFMPHNGPTTWETLKPLRHHLYQPAPLHVAQPANGHKTSHSFFITEDLRREAVDRNEAKAQAPPPDSALPAEVHLYHSLVPLETTEAKPSVFGQASIVYKAWCKTDGRVYALKRIQGYRLQHESSILQVEAWRHIQHPSLVAFKEAFTTRAFGDMSLVFVYDYYPLSETLLEKYFKADRRPRPLRSQQALSEKEVWSFIAQLVSAMQTAHAAGLNIRVVDLSHILVTGKHRVRLNQCGIWDLLGCDVNKGTPLPFVPLEDFVSLGRVVASLIAGAPITPQNSNQVLEAATRQVSADLQTFLFYLLAPSANATMDTLAAMLSTHFAAEMEATLCYADTLEHELGRELENGRLVRLMSKLGFINERPEFALDPRWSETGDRYLIKLFRDYVFHQVDEQGLPVVNLAHVLVCLNKLDAGIDERIMLVSRDEKTCLIVTYRDLKRCVDDAFRDLSQPPRPFDKF